VAKWYQYRLNLSLKGDRKRFSANTALLALKFKFPTTLYSYINLYNRTERRKTTREGREVANVTVLDDGGGGGMRGWSQLQQASTAFYFVKLFCLERYRNDRLLLVY
jgi:hypothetical protein